MFRFLGIVCLFAAGCSSSSRPSADAQAVKMWHTFGGDETEALNGILAERDGEPVEVTRISFARGHVILREILEDGERCPDVLRIDATWLATLASQLAPVPDAVKGARDWLPAAWTLATVGEVALGLPQSVDGLALIARREVVRSPGVSWPPTTIAELEASARALSQDRDFGLDVRFDAFWFLPFLRAGGADVLDPVSGRLGIDRPEAITALERFAAMFGPGGIAPPITPAGAEFREVARRFADDRVAIVLEGPWAISGLSIAGELEIAAFPGGAATRGGQLFVVPRCAKRPEAGWALALDLTAPAVQAKWGRELGVVPTTAAGLADAGAIANGFYRALADSRPLPKHPVTPELFDDLSPAIAAVVANDATATEALAGVARAWRRLRRRHSIEAPP